MGLFCDMDAVSRYVWSTHQRQRQSLPFCILHAEKISTHGLLYFRLERAVAETCCAPLSTLGTQLALVYSSQTHVPWFTLRKVVCCVWPSVVDEALLWSPLGPTSPHDPNLQRPMTSLQLNVLYRPLRPSSQWALREGGGWAVVDMDFKRLSTVYGKRTGTEPPPCPIRLNPPVHAADGSQSLGR